MLLILMTLACSRCPVDDPIAPGCGVELDAGTVRLGEASADVVKRLGEPTSTADLGILGTTARYEEASLRYEDGLLTAIYLESGFAGTTADGVGLGASEASVSGALGEARVDPFQGSWSYSGLTLEWTEGEVSRVVVH